MRALGKSTLESKGDGDSERRCKPFPMGPDFCMTGNSSAERAGAIVLVGCVGFLCNRRSAARAGSTRSTPERQYILFCESRFNDIRRDDRDCLKQRCRSRRARDRTHHAKMRHAPQIASRPWIHAKRGRVRIPHYRAWFCRARSRPARHAQRIQSKEDCNERKPESDGVSTGHGVPAGSCT
jgi:hypothetical protein